MSKELGQVAFEVYSRLVFGGMPWREIGSKSKKAFAITEAAVRADERERLRAENDTLRAALRVNALRWEPGASHEQIDAWIDGIAKPIQETPREPTEIK